MLSMHSLADLGKGTLMRNVLRVFARDAKRVAKTPAAWLVALFLIVLPSLYTWFNVAGFWNPYDNTGALRICVVNEDAGASDETLGELNLGEQIVSQLEKDTRLGWAFTDREQAMSEVESGRAYAAFIIPESFSADAATLATGNFTAPKLEYYVNEKTGPVAPKVTDTGATTLDTTVNDTFVSVASGIAASAVDEALGRARSDFSAVQQGAVGKISDATAAVSAARETLADLDEAAQGAIEKAESAKGTLSDAKSQAALLASMLGDVSEASADASAGIVDFSLSAGVALDGASRLLSQSSAQASAAVTQIAASIGAAQGDADAALSRAEAVIQENERLVATVEDLAASLPEGAQKDALVQLAKNLKSSNARAQQAVEDLSALASSLAGFSDSAAGAASSVDSSVQNALAGADAFRDSLSTTAIPALSGALGGIGTASNGLSSTVAGQSSLIDQTLSALGELQSTLSLSSDALAQTDGLLAQLESDFDAAATDVAAIGSSDALKGLFGEGLDPSALADFMMSPTTVQTERLYPLNAYGSAMAPLFINLTLWIGAFMLMVIMRIEVDGEGVPGLTASQRYLGRWLLLAVMAMLQSAVCCAGCLAMGVQTASAPTLFLTAAGISLAYVSIQYALSTTLQHVGKGLCVVLAFIQIPAATGLYPVEMTTEFFQAICPAFPFTYGIGAMREVIGGFYGDAWLRDMGALAAFFVASMAFGLVVRPYATNLNHLFARQLEESDLIAGESVQLPARRYRMAQMARMLSNRKEYRSIVSARAARFVRMYPKVKRAAFAAGVAVPAVGLAALSALHADKSIALAGLLAWFVAAMLFIVALEYVRDGIVGQIELDAMGDDEVRALLSARSGVQKPAEAGEASEGGAL